MSRDIERVEVGSSASQFQGPIVARFQLLRLLVSSSRVASQTPKIGMFRNSSWFKVKVSILQDTSRVSDEFPRVSAGFENK